MEGKERANKERQWVEKNAKEGLRERINDYMDKAKKGDVGEANDGFGKQQGL